MSRYSRRYRSGAATVRARRSAETAARIARRPADLALRIILVLCGIVAIVVPALLVQFGPKVEPRLRHAIHAARHRVVPMAEVPPVEPVAFENLTPEDARTFNATVPFSTEPNPAAHPFHLTGTPEQQARATDCLAAAMLYEAGDDPEGQRAVGQVIINRVRHPAFPKTICGVVFQGSERTTGCQFTFTCDGALIRHQWAAVQWVRARANAAAALGGAVFAAVGYSTHYHTNWVVPYWQSSLDKVAAVHTHLFFRWTGWWGTPPAFNRQVSSDEPIIRQLAAYSDAHKVGAVLVDVTVAAAQIAALPPEAIPSPLPNDSETFLVTVDPHMPSDSFALFAAKACGERPRCKLMAWADRTRTPTAMPLDTGQIDAMAFSYMRDRTYHYDKPLWNCALFKRADPTQCMKVQVMVPVAKDTNAASATVKPPATGPIIPAPEGLSGIRRKPAPAAIATPVRPDSPTDAQSR